MAPPPRPRPTGDGASSSSSALASPRVPPSPSPSTSSRATTTLRLPRSIRAPSARKSSTPHISLVFAQAAPSSPLPPTRTQRTASGAEEALSRQLDGDLGGRTMGLRSRTGSNATVRTFRTLSGRRTPSPSKSVMEEPEIEAGDEEELRGRAAGPSTSRVGSGGGMTDRELLGISEGSGAEGETAKAARLNPKASSSWMRWNSPGPTFPKAKDKGKGRADGVDTSNQRPTETASTKGPASAVPLEPPSQTGTSVEDRQLAETPADPANVPVEPANEPIPVEATNSSKPAVPLVPAPAPSKGWWGWGGARERTTSSSVPSTTPATPSQSSSKGAQPTTEPLALAQEAHPSARDPQSLKEEPVPPQQPNATASAVDAADKAISDAPPSPLEHAPSVAPTVDTAKSKSWGAYLGVGTSTKGVPSTPAKDSVATPIPADVVDIAQSGSVSAPQEDSLAVVPQAADKNTQSDNSGSSTQPTNEQANNSTWGSFFYSLVIPPTRPAKPSISTTQSRSNVVEPTSPTEDQKPVPTALVSSQSTQPDSAPAAQTSLSTSQPSSLTAATPESKSSTNAGASGWFNYLTFSAGQKKIANPSSDKAGPREPNEEVMDFSSDPDFPPSAPDPTTTTEAAKEGPASGIGAGKGKIVTGKASQNLDVRKKRLSNASAHTGSSMVPIPPSPRAKSIEGDRTPASTRTAASSALPPPPQAPSVQSNLVIPNFKTTFDRPPRSLLPDKPAETTITAATTGMAWRALGAMGSYVLPGKETPKETKIPEAPKETRGQKEGRHVGAELPRRLGLDGLPPDDGWRNVTRVVVVGVHGWFPAKMLNSVIGEPTGTSTKFANMMGQAVKQFFEERGVKEFRLTLMPLEGEGTIDHRVDKLYKAYLSNPAWINDLRRADAIFFAAHSQGCIVTTHLISRMIAQGHIRTPLNAESVDRCEWGFGPVGVVPQETRGKRGGQPTTIMGSDGGYQKIAMLAMCGVHLGPFYSISTSSVSQAYLWFENPAAKELFEFQDSNSAVSMAYQRALSMVLENGVRVLLLASLNDQVVPIYGASYSSASHPLLLRALFVDGASYSAEDFMTNLLCFAFMLRNAGIDDQRLIEHLSEATAGSLTGIGHSAAYEELACYSLAVDYLFLVGPAASLPPLSVEQFSAREGRNDFELPWIMRGLVDAPEIKDLFPGELRDLKEGILHWKPNTRPLREIKKRLEPVAGRRPLRPLHDSPSSTSLVSQGQPRRSAELGASPGANKSLGIGLKRDW